MNLGEKIFKLRKERGRSQEALAEQLGTSRQAVSKWENNQGFPEMEKLLQLSNLFEVSVDFLLKDEKAETESSEKGYYVSREFAREYLANAQKENRYMGFCFLFWAFTGIPYAIFPSHTALRMLGISVCIFLGILAWILALFSEQDKFKILRREPLLFDYEVLKELSSEYREIEKKCRFVAIPGLFLFIAGMLIISFTASGKIPWSAYHSLVFLGFAVGLAGFVWSIGKMESYELLVKNKQYSSRLLFRLKKRLREKLDRL